MALPAALHGPLVIGVDFGGVCAAHAAAYEREHRQAGDEADVSINVPGALDALRALKAQGHTLVLISYCGPARAARTQPVLHELRLFDQMFFTAKRSFKTHICRLVGADVLIDDRLDILATVAPTQTLHFTFEDNGDAVPGFRPDFTAATWDEVLRVVPGIRSLHRAPDLTVDACEYCHGVRPAKQLKWRQKKGKTKL